MQPVTVAGLTFQNPILNASGCFNPGLFHRIAPLGQTLGGIVTKTVTPQPRPGNPQQRTVELPGVGMLNSIGLQNPGLAYTLDVEAPELGRYGIPVILSIAASDVDDFAHMVQQIVTHPNGHYVAALEVNLSCPNVAKGGVDFGGSPDILRAVTQTVTDGFGGPVFAKLTPNVASIVPLAEAAMEGGACGITAINTLLGTAINLKTKRPYLPRVSGGYSGPGIMPIALHHVWQIHKALPQVPIIGVGGIQCADDVLAFMLAGASLVQVGTSCFRTPTIFAQLVAALESYRQEHQLDSLSQLTGLAHQPAGVG